MASRPSSAEIVLKVRGCATQKVMRFSNGLRDAMDGYPADPFERRICTVYAAGYGVDFMSDTRQVEREIGDDLAGGGGVRKEEPVEEEDSHGCAYCGRKITRSPNTRQSMFVRTKQSSASAGVQTIGSLSLNDVFSTIGTPVRSRKASMRR